MGNLAANDHIDRIFKVFETNDLRKLSFPAAQGLYACVWPLFTNILFSETTLHIKVKFYVEPSWERGT